MMERLGDKQLRNRIQVIRNPCTAMNAEGIKNSTTKGMKPFTRQKSLELFTDLRHKAILPSCGFNLYHEFCGFGFAFKGAGSIPVQFILALGFCNR